MSLDKKTTWLNERGQLVLLLGGVTGVLFLMFLLKNLFNPLGYGLIVGIILYPIRRQPVARALLYATAFLAGLWLLYDSGHLLIPFILAYILAFVINPVVEVLQRRGIKRWITAAGFTTVGLSVIGLGLFFGLPVLIRQIVKLGNLLIEATGNTGQWLTNIGFFNILHRIGLDSGDLRNQITVEVHDYLVVLYNHITHFSSGVITGFGSAITVLFFIILLPFLLFFMIRDYDKIGGFVRTLITPKGVKDSYTHEISRIVGAYLRGQFIVVVISAINLSIGFSIFGVPYALLLGIFSGLTNFIPTFGLWFSITVCTIISASLGHPWYHYLPAIYLVFGIEQILETGWIVPRVVGNRVGLHPLLVMLSLLLFGFMFGFLGLLIAVPTAALLSVFYEQYRRTNRISFLGGSELDALFEYFDESTGEKET